MDILDYVKPGYRKYEFENGKIYCAKENSCLFCRHCTDIFYDHNGPYLLVCELELSCEAGMSGNCKRFEEGEQSDE